MSTSLYDEELDRRQDFGLSDIFGVHSTEEHHGSLVPPTQDWQEYSQHSYLRIDCPKSSGLFSGFSNTDILPFGG